MMNRELSMEFVRVTEAAAIASARGVGRGDKNGIDQLAVDAMRKMFDTVNISGTVVIGEGEMDEAPMLYIGEHVGAGGPEVDIAVDPVEGTNLVAKGQPGAIAVIAIAPKGCLLHAPDMYMDKIAVGPRAKGCINIDDPVSANLERVAKALNRKVGDLTVLPLTVPVIARSLKKSGQPVPGSVSSAMGMSIRSSMLGLKEPASICTSAAAVPRKVSLLQLGSNAWAAICRPVSARKMKNRKNAAIRWAFPM